MINKRVSDISCDSDQCHKAAPDYDTALKKSGFNENTKYLPSQPKQRNRKRQIIWFNPPQSVNVKANVSKLFMRLIDKHFPRHHKLHELFNRNNVKLSYICMPNMKSVIQKHNSKIMEDPKPTNNKTYSCRQKSDCLGYNAVVNTSATKNYFGTFEKSFKERYGNHTSSFTNKSRQKSIELSNYIWELKVNDENYTIDRIIAMKAYPYICETRKCDLCLREKLLIARADSESLLNKRDQLVSKCHHMNKFTLKCSKNWQNVILLILFITICSFRFRYKTNIADHLMIG